MESGQVLSIIESAHYMQINDLDLNGDMLITGGTDCKVKVWLIADLLSNDPLKNSCFVEFGEHTSDVTQVKFCSANPTRAFSASLDKQFKVYDIPSKLCVKTILIQSPITKVVMD
jgi:WD40 repeat protein